VLFGPTLFAAIPLLKRFNFEIQKAGMNAFVLARPSIAVFLRPRTKKVGSEFGEIKKRSFRRRLKKLYLDSKSRQNAQAPPAVGRVKYCA